LSGQAQGFGFRIAFDYGNLEAYSLYTEYQKKLHLWLDNFGKNAIKKETSQNMLYVLNGSRSPIRRRNLGK